MLKYTSDKIVCHADVQRAIGAVCHDINPAASHTAIVKNVDGWDKPGHDG